MGLRLAIGAGAGTAGACRRCGGSTKGNEALGLEVRYDGGLVSCLCCRRIEVGSIGAFITH